MKPAPFRYVAARSIEQALALKAEHGDEARFLAGGQSLVPTMNFRLTQPAMLIDINPLTGLAGIGNGAADRVRIGALTRYRVLERDPATERTLPLIHEALPLIAHPQIRNRGTIGGNLAHADPASEMPAIVLTLGGRLRAQSAKGERWIDARDFFVGALTTALEPTRCSRRSSFPSRRRVPARAFWNCRDGAAISPSSASRARCASTTTESAPKRASVFATPATGRSLPTTASASLIGEQIGAPEIAAGGRARARRDRSRRQHPCQQGISAPSRRRADHARADDGQREGAA